MAESFIQVPPDSSGKKIRNLQLLIQQPDGSISTIQLQVIAVADENGNPVRFLDERDIQQQSLDELRAIRMGIQFLVSWLNPAASLVTVRPSATGGGTVNIPLATDSGAGEHELIETALDLRQDDTT